MLFASESSEVINTVAIAMKTGQDCTFLRDFIFTHPSMSEALNELFFCSRIGGTTATLNKEPIICVYLI